MVIPQDGWYMEPFATSGVHRDPSLLPFRIHSGEAAIPVLRGGLMLSHWKVKCNTAYGGPRHKDMDVI